LTDYRQENWLGHVLRSESLLCAVLELRQNGMDKNAWQLRRWIGWRATIWNMII